MAKEPGPIPPELAPAVSLPAADLVEDGERLLDDVLASLPAAQVAQVRKKCPQGLPALLNGLEAGHGLPALPGFGQRRYSDLDTVNVQPALELYQQHVAARIRDKSPGRAGRGPRDGWAAARQYQQAARAVVALLIGHGQLTGDPLHGLRRPKAPAPARDRALTIEERRQFCRIVMLQAADPVLAALIWMLWVIYGARNVEIERLREADLNVARSSIVLVGRGGRRRERPLHRPLARLLDQQMALRPSAPGGQLLRTREGRPVTRRTWNTWSKWLHRWAEWAQGFNISVYSLRHTAARVPLEHGFDTAQAGRWIGHANPGGLKTTPTYAFDWSEGGDWEESVAMIEAIFGPLEGFPVLPENDILGPVLGLDLPMPAAPPASRRTARKGQKDDTHT